MPDASDRIALPIRVHEFLLACAGRVDDDVLTDAREFLAVAELDRAVELLAASLVAGRIPLTADERDELRDLLDMVRSTRALVDRIVVDDLNLPPRHRFTVGTEDDPAPDEGVASALERVLGVLPDIHGVTVVWRTTPAGRPAGPVPQRLVLVEAGPDGFATSTAYRIEQTLRRAGIRAAVEVLVAGTDLGMYHRDALDCGRRLDLRTEPPAARRTPPPAPAAPPESLYDQPAPRSVTSTRRRAAHSEKRPAAESASGRWQQRVSAADPGPAEPAPVESRPSQIPPMPELPALAAEPSSTMSREPSGRDGVSRDSRDSREPVGREPSVGEFGREPAGNEFGREPSGNDFGREVGRESRTGLTPVPPPPSPAPVPPAAVPPAPVANGSAQPPVRPVDATKDSDLSQREQELLRQLHEELAKREEQGPEQSGEPFGWTVDRSSAMNNNGMPPGHNSGAFPPVEYPPGWQTNAEQTAVNGIPPYGMPQG